MYKGTAPKKPKNSPAPAPRPPKTKKTVGKLSLRKPPKDPLQGLREAREEDKMIKFQPKPAAAQKPVEKKPAPGPVHVESKMQGKHTETERDRPIEKDLPDETVPSKPPIRPGVNPSRLPPPSDSSAPRLSPYLRPIPPRTQAQDRRWLYASAAAVLFLGGVLLYRSAAGPTQTPIVLREDPNFKDASPPKTNDLSAVASRRGPNVAKAIEVLQSVFGERCSTLTEDLVDFGGEGILGLGTGKVPTAVVWPVSTEEVEVILKVAETYRVPIIPYSGGTSIEGYQRNTPWIA